MPHLRNKKKKLADYVLDEIKRMLLSGELKEGDKLPNQSLFAEQLGVSRLPLREAIHTLQLMGVIEQKPGAGTIILSGNPHQWEQKPAPPMLSDSQATLELLETRKIVETHAMRLALVRISKEELKSLKTDIAIMKNSLKAENRKQYLKADMSFHFHLANASHNRYLVHMFLTIHGLMEQFMVEVFDLIPDLMENSMDYHSTIYDELSRRNGDKAVTVMEAHLSSVETAVKAYYSKNKIAY